MSNTAALSPLPRASLLLAVAAVAALLVAVTPTAAMSQSYSGQTYPSCWVSGGNVHFDGSGWSHFSGQMYTELHYFVPGVPWKQVLGTRTVSGTQGQNTWTYSTSYSRSHPGSSSTFYAKSYIYDSESTVGVNTSQCSG